MLDGQNGLIPVILLAALSFSTGPARNLWKRDTLSLFLLDNVNVNVETVVHDFQLNCTDGLNCGIMKLKKHDGRATV